MFEAAFLIVSKKRDCVEKRGLKMPDGKDEMETGCGNMPCARPAGAFPDPATIAV
jgi:hypothetical protein